MPGDDRLSRPGLLYLLVVYIVWGSTYLAIRVAVREGAGFPPFTLGAMRVLVAGAMLLGLAALGRQRLRPARGELAVLASSGLLLWPAANGLVVLGEMRADSGYAALLVGSMPIWVAIMESHLDRRLPTALLIGSLLIGFGGIGLLAYPVLQHGSRADALAVVALLLAPISWGAGSVLQQRRPVRMPVLAAAGWQQLCGGIGFVAVALLRGEPRPTPTPEAWGAWAYLVVFGSLIGFTSFVQTLRLLPMNVSMTYAYANPVVAVILGHLILREPVTSWTAAGAAMVIIGVAGVFRNRRRGSPPRAGSRSRAESGRTSASARM